MKVRSFLAPNPGPFTYDGTRSYVVGGDGNAPGNDSAQNVAIIDPGPVLPQHLDTLAKAVDGARNVNILLTHAHADHSAGAARLAEMTSAAVVGPGAKAQLHDGKRFPTDSGTLIALSTPGHERCHFCFHLPRANAVFTGDLILGEGDTTWIGAYSGGVADYFRSLDRLATLDAKTFYPGHGPPIDDPSAAIARFRSHRLARIEQVQNVLAAGAASDSRAITQAVYGPLPADVFAMAQKGVETILDYLSEAGT